MPSEIKQGKILLAVAPGRRGNGERRPMVVIDPPDEDGFFLAAVGSKQRAHNESYEVKLIHGPDGVKNPYTGLYHQTYIDASWIAEIHVDSAVPAGGVFGELLNTILVKSNEYMDAHPELFE